MRPHTSLVLTGILDPKEYPYRQYFIGVLVIYTKPKTGEHVITLINESPATKKGSPEDPYIPRFELSRPGEYTLSFPDYNNRCGLKITVSKKHQEFIYEHGFDPELPSSKGNIMNGEWIVDVLDEYFENLQQ